jgi:hypothetical protein
MIKARALDNATNQAEAGPVTLTFDETSKPTVTAIDLTPDSPVGEGSVTFTITFSEAMNQSVAPTVVFGYTPMTVVGAYTDSVTWQGSYTIQAGYDGAQTITVSGASDMYTNTMDPDSSHTFTVDTTSPTAPVIRTSAQSIKSNAMVISLSTQSQDDNFSHYQLKGGREYTDWTNTTLTDNFVFVLVPGEDNTLRIRAVDKAGNVSGESSVDITSEFIYEMGDINGDRTVGLADALLALQVLNRVDTQNGVAPDYEYSGADVDGNGKVGLAEVVYIVRHLAGLN